MAADEIVDVLDEHASLTGIVKAKREVHDKGLRHAAVHLWIYNSKGEILLQHRSPEKEIFPDTLDISVAGHQTAGDTPTDAAIREAEEELGLLVEAEELQFIGITRTDMLIPPRNWMHRVYDWNYLLQKDVARDELTLQTEEVYDAVWMSLDDFERELHDPKTNPKYSPHPLYLYDMAIFEIRKALGEYNTSREHADHYPGSQL